MTIDEICEKLVEGQWQRQSLIRMETALLNQRRSMVCHALGFHGNTPKERDRIRSLADELIKTALAGKASPIEPGIVMRLKKRLPTFELIAKEREEIEESMRYYARELPVWPWVESVRGVSDLSLAVIVGECGTKGVMGNIGAYHSVGNFQKRLGYGVVDGERQRKHAGLNQEETLRIGFRSRSYGQVRAFVQVALLLHQLKKNNPGPYGVEYHRKKAEYLVRGLTPKHADNAAKRYAAKCFLRDLYFEWRRDQEFNVVVPSHQRPADMAQQWA